MKVAGLFILGVLAYDPLGAAPCDDPPEAKVSEAKASSAAGPRPADDVRPTAGRLRRPKRVWLHEAVQTPSRGGMATDGKSLYVLRADRQKVVAFTAATGREIWAAKVASRAEQVVFNDSGKVAVSGGVVVVGGSDEQLTGFAAADGKQLWTRKEPCDIESAAGPWVIMRCRGSIKQNDGGLRIIDIRNGRVTRAVPFDWLGEFVASERALFTWRKADRTLRKTPLLRGEMGWATAIGADFIEEILADGGAVICVGRDIQAFDAATGKLLWSKRPVGSHRGLSVAPVLHGGRLYLGTVDAIVAVDARSGQEQRRYPLPAFLRPRPADHHFNGLFVSGERVLLVNNPAQVAGHYLMATWAAPGQAPQLLARPIALGWEPVLVGDLLVGLVDYDNYAAGYSLAELQPAVADLPRVDAIRAIDAETAQAPRLRRFVLDQIPGATSTPARAPMQFAETVRPGVCKAAVRKVKELQPGTPPGLFGTAHPIQVEAVAPDGRWISACQARRDTNGDGVVDVIFGHHGEPLGDDMRPYLIVGGGAGHPFDELIDHSLSGRYVAVREAACLNLIDIVEGTSTTLADADLRDPEPALGPRRGLSFDAVDKRVLYLRAGARGDRVVVRDLKSGRETEIDPGPGLVVHAALDPEGEAVVIDAALGDHLPRLHTTLAPRSCRGEAASYSVFGSDAAPVMVRRIAPATGGRARELPGVIRSFGEAVLIRQEDSSLVVQDAVGQRRMVAPAACGATVSHIDAGRRVVVFACESDADQHGNARLSLYRDGTITKLRAIDDVERGDHWAQTTGRYAPIHGSVIDLDKPDRPPPASAYAGLQPRRFFVRSDGHELRPLKGAGDSSFGRAEIGPVQWVSPTD